MKRMLLLTLLLAMTASLLPAQTGWVYQNPAFSISNLNGAICALDKDTVIVITDKGRMIYTSNGGANWAEINYNLSASFFDLAWGDGIGGMAVGQNGSILRINDGTLLNSGTTHDLFSVCFSGPDEIWAAGDSGTILHSADGGSTWNPVTMPVNTRFNAIAFRGSGGVIAGNGGVLLVTTDGGQTWTPANSGTTQDLFGLCMTPSYAYALAGTASSSYPNYLFLADNLVRSADLANWTMFSIGWGIPGMSGICFTGDDTGFSIGSGITTNREMLLRIDKTTDTALTWNPSLNDWDPPAAVGRGDIDFATDSIGYALCGNNILKTTDGGTWVGIGEIGNETTLSAWPNPARDEVRVAVAGHQSPGKGIWTVVNAFGVTVLTVPFTSETQTLNIRSLPAGVYTVSLEAEGRRLGSRVFIKGLTIDD